MADNNMTDKNKENRSADELLSILEQYSDDAKQQRGGFATVDKEENITEEATVRPVPEGGHFSEDLDEDFASGENAGSERIECAENEKTALYDFEINEEEASQPAVRNTEGARRAELRKKYKKAKERNREKKKKGGVAVSLVKALVYICAVLVFSAFMVFGFFDIWPGIVPMANDIFAFVKTDAQVIVNIQEGMTTPQVAKLLVDKKIIEQEKVFEFYVLYKNAGKTRSDDDSIVSSVMHMGTQFVGVMFFGDTIEPENDIKYIAGEHTLSSNMNYDQILSELTKISYARSEVKVTIPEGYTVEQIVELLLSNGIGDRERYIYVINEYPFKHEFVQLIEDKGYSEDRKYRLEGYLFPDTYVFYQDADEVSVINKMLNNFDLRFWDEYESTYKKACEEAGLSFDEIITLASIVQAEGRSFSDYENVAQVFYNRFNSSAYTHMESCATVQYFLEERHEILTAEDIRTDNPYNTYIYEGLPPGAVCNPGLDAIEATLYPDMSTEVLEKFDISKAYFFNSDLAGNIYYAQTESQHTRNKATADRVNQQIIEGNYVTEESDAGE